SAEEEALLRRANEARQRAQAEDSARNSQSGVRASVPLPMQEALGSSNPADRVLAEKHRQQQELLQKLNAALKQSVAPAPTAPSPSAPRPLASPPAQARPPAPVPIAIPTFRAESARPGMPKPIASPPAPPAPKPVVFGGAGQTAGAGGLWNNDPEATQPGPSPASFEEALRRVDSSLEALVGPPGAAPADEPIIEAVVEVQGTESKQNREESTLDDPTDGADAAKLRRQRLLKRAMESLGGSKPAPARDTSSSPSGVSSPSPAPAPAASNTPPPSSALQISAADQQLATQIEQRFEQQQKKDHFATLGLAPNATREQVKTAFLNLAKVFHPDRLPPSLPALASKMSTVFEGIREAYDVLYDDTRRSVYVAQKVASAPPPPVPPAQQAADLMKVGEAAFKKRDYRSADEAFAKAHALDKAANSLAAQGWAIYMDPARKTDAATAKTMMQKALSLDGNCDRAHYQLGVIARVEGDMDRAEKFFRDALRTNPKHLEANQELRLIEMRKKKGPPEPPPKKGGGFFR
ncbi:MAG: J domain-containing protein, partial [Archangium sp.]|nr:J domain-containing protein [Archangium sp.]